MNIKNVILALSLSFTLSGALIFAPLALAKKTVATLLPNSGPPREIAGSEKKQSAGGLDSAGNAPTHSPEQVDGFWTRTHLRELLDKVLESVLGDFIGFLTLGTVLSLLLRKHIGELVEAGLKYIGATLADAFDKKLAMPLVVQATSVGNDLKKFMLSQSVPGVKQEHMDVSASVEAELTKIDALLQQNKLDQAFLDVTELRKRYPSELEVLRKIIEVSENANANPTSRTRTLEIIKTAEQDFSKNPDYFTLLAMCLVAARESGPRAKMYKDALLAAKKSKGCESNPEKIPRRVSVISMVHFYFSNIEDAVTTAEDALQMLSELKSEIALESAARVKNNLAYYLAERGAPGDKARAMELAEGALAYDEEKQAMDYLPADWDTVGYVRFRFAEEKRDVEEALSYFQKALDAAPGDVDYNKHVLIAQTTLQSF